MNLKKIIIGYILIVYGILGELLPLLEGLLFIAIGLLLLKDDVQWVQRLLNEWIKEDSFARKILDFLSKKIDKLSHTLGISNKDPK